MGSLANRALVRCQVIIFFGDERHPELVSGSDPTSLKP
jgi:hypothetical protein